MKTLVTLLLLTLICFLYHISAGPVAPYSLTQQCCPNCTRTRIPKGKVKNVVETRSVCSLKAIVVTTVCDTKICVDGNWTWAKNLLTEFEKSPPSAPFNRFPCSKGVNRV